MNLNINIDEFNLNVFDLIKDNVNEFVYFRLFILNFVIIKFLILKCNRCFL